MMQQGAPIPVHVDAPSAYSPIHEDDLIAQVPALLDAAAVPPTVVNWGGPETVSVEEWCTYLGELTGLTPTFAPSDQVIESVVADTTRLQQIAPPCRVDWRDGMRRMVAANNPELLELALTRPAHPVSGRSCPLGGPDRPQRREAAVRASGRARRGSSRR